MRLPADDEGRASERTALSWTRSGALLASVGGLGLTSAAHQGSMTRGLIMVIVLPSLGCVVAIRGRRRYVRRRAEERYLGDPIGVLLVVGSTLMASILGAIILLGVP